MNRMVSLLVVVLALGGCQRRHPVNNNPTTLPTPAGVVEYVNTRKGIHLSYPARWIVHPSGDYVLLLMPPGLDRSQICSLSLDIPDLPPHLPGMIRMGMVKNGYLDDLRQKAPGLSLIEDQPHDLKNATGHLVRTTWTFQDQSFHESALLLIHNGDVFIIRATSDAEHLPLARSTFEQVIASIRWQ